MWTDRWLKGNTGKYDGEGNLHRYRGESMNGTDIHYLSIQQQTLNFQLIYLNFDVQHLCCVNHKLTVSVRTVINTTN